MKTRSVIKVLDMAIIVRAACISLVLACPGLAQGSFPGVVREAFLENKGQWPEAVLFGTVDDSGFVALDREGLLFSSEPGGRSGIRLGFHPSAAGVVVTGESELPGHVNFLRGPTDRWGLGVRRYSSVLYQGVSDGVDVRVRWARGRLEYDLLLRPRADVSAVVMAYPEHLAASVTDEGALVLEGQAMRLEQPRPLSWYSTPNGRMTVQCGYRLLGPGRFGFELQSGEKELPLTIDPGLEWSTYLGGTNADLVTDVATDPRGGVIVVGTTKSSDFPSTPGALDREFTSNSPVCCRELDAFVAAFEPQGDLRWATFLGGARRETSVRVAADAESVYVVGSTTSPDFPLTPRAFQTELHFIDFQSSYIDDAFVCKLSADGGELLYSTLLGGTISTLPGTFGIGSEIPLAVAVAPEGRLVVVGSTLSDDFPTTPGAYDTEWKNIFVSQLSADGSNLVFSTFLGGPISQGVDGVAVAPDGRVLVTGNTQGGFPPGSGPGEFLLFLSAEGDEILSWTTLDWNLTDRLERAVLRPDGRVLVAGWTSSSDLPTTEGVFQPFKGSVFFPDSFLGLLSPDLSRFEFLTYVGGVVGGSMGLAVDSSGVITLAGVTDFLGYPNTEGAYSNTIAGMPHGLGYDREFYVTRMSPDGRRVFYSTFLGGEDWERDRVGLVVDELGAAYLAGTSESAGYPTTEGALRNEVGGVLNGVVSKLDMLPTGVRTFGKSTPGCSGPLTLGVTAMPRVGSTVFGVTCSGSPPDSALGLLLVSGRPLAAPLSAGGVGLWIDPNEIVAALPLSSGELGYAELPARVPRMPGVRASVQAVWVDACVPGGVVASQALEIEIQQ